eukprot:gene7002-9592_t
MRERILTACERAFITEALQEGVIDDQPLRLDGRGKNDMRKVTVEVGPQYGQAHVALGHTRVLCCINCRLVRPHEDRPTRGFVRFNVTLSPMASPDYEPSTRQSEASINLTQLLEHVFRDARTIDTDSLCIVTGEKVWNIQVNVTILNDDGNLDDACVLAALAGLLHFRRPYVSISGDNVIVHPVDEHEPVSLSINHRPLNVSTAIFEQGSLALVDPTRIEMQVAEGSISVAMNTHHEICSINSSSGCAIDPEMMFSIVSAAKPRVAELFDALNKAFPSEDNIKTGSTQRAIKTDKTQHPWPGPKAQEVAIVDLEARVNLPVTLSNTLQLVFLLDSKRV